MRIGSKEVQLKWKFTPMNISSMSQRSGLKGRQHSLAYKGNSIRGLAEDVMQIRFKVRSTVHRSLNKPKSVGIGSLDLRTHLNLPRSRDPDCDSSNCNEFSQYVSKIL